MTVAPNLVRLGPLRLIPRGEGRVFQIGAHSIAIFHTRKGAVYATEPFCPHKGGPLADGVLGDSRVICPLHNFVFDLSTGRPLGNGCRPVRTYHATVNEEGDVLVDVGLL